MLLRAVSPISISPYAGWSLCLSSCHSPGREAEEEYWGKGATSKTNILNGAPFLFLLFLSPPILPRTCLARVTDFSFRGQCVWLDACLLFWCRQHSCRHFIHTLGLMSYPIHPRAGWRASSRKPTVLRTLTPCCTKAWTPHVKGRLILRSGSFNPLQILDPSLSPLTAGVRCLPFSENQPLYYSQAQEDTCNSWMGCILAILVNMESCVVSLFSCENIVYFTYIDQGTLGHSLVQALATTKGHKKWCLLGCYTCCMAHWFTLKVF